MCKRCRCWRTHSETAAATAEPCGQAEYVRFKTAAQHSGIVQELHEIVWLDELWQEASRAAA